MVDSAFLKAFIYGDLNNSKIKSKTDLAQF